MISHQGLGVDKTVLGPVLSTGVSVGAGFATAAIAGSSMTVPIVGAAVAGVTLAIGLFLNRKRPKQKVATTQVINEAKDLWQQNVQAWQASNKTKADYDQSIANFWSIHEAWLAGCGNPEMGEPGKWCIEGNLSPGKTLSYGGKTYTGTGPWDVYDNYLAPIQNEQGMINQDFFGTPITGQGGQGLLLGGLALVAGALFLMGQGNNK